MRKLKEQHTISFSSSQTQHIFKHGYDLSIYS